ncbi:hypothetical protein K2P47_01975 [Patescibacteria group bacterium]|nr:hypothetical protein [Patescibacteria group bacterium]
MIKHFVRLVHATTSQVLYKLITLPMTPRENDSIEFEVLGIVVKRKVKYAGFKDKSPNICLVVENDVVSDKQFESLKNDPDNLFGSDP